MPELQVIAHYTISAGRENEVLPLLSRLAKATRAEPGNVSFLVYGQLDDERDVALLERYASRDAFALHRESPHFRELVLDEIVPRLDSRTVELYDVVD